MRDQIDLKGASGAVYRFSLFKDGRPLSPMGGNYAFVREEGDEAVVLLTGEAQNLMTDARQRWDEAVAMHGATHIFSRLNITERVRKSEEADLSAGLKPPMNAAGPPELKAG